ncbi:MAG: hypothetical protein QOE33_2820 [Acidobacteriota bacterium]|nr:hypothetical protein [Acidobacteriota bacterium]
MTTEDHNKTLGILHLVYGGLHGLLLALMFAISAPVLYILTHAPNRDAPPFAFILFALGIGFFISMLLFIPTLVAGYGLLKRKSWGRTAGIVAAILAALNIPFGTALAVYSFWFLFGKGQRLYRDEFAQFSRYSLNDAPPRPASEWMGEQREPEYAPPAQPPDWRD